jgi:hypothetical protein
MSGRKPHDPITSRIDGNEFMTKMFQIHEVDLESLEEIVPMIHAGNIDQDSILMLMQIVKNVRSNYGPHTDSYKIDEFGDNL